MGCSSSKNLGKFKVKLSSAQKVEYLAKTPFSKELGDEGLTKLADFTDSFKVPEGAVIITEGEVGDRFYIICEGVVAISVKGQELTTKEAGTLLGELAVTQDNHIRTATVTANSACVLLCLTRSSFNKYITSGSTAQKKSGTTAKVAPGAVVVQETPAERMMAMLTVLDEHMLSSLKQIDFLKLHTSEDLRLLANLLRMRALGKGDQVFEEGTLGRELYIVTKGTVAVSTENEEGKQVWLEDIGKGGFFGEVALLVNTPRTATVVATEPTTLLELSHENYQKFLNIAPEQAAEFKRISAERATRLFKKFNVPFFAAINEEQLYNLSMICDVTRHEPGSVIFNEGDNGNCFYINVWGVMEVLQSGKQVSTLRAGSYFGEIALVTDKPRNATIRVGQKGAVTLSLTKENFAEFFSHAPEAYADFTIRLSQRSAPFEASMKHPSALKYFEQHTDNEQCREALDFWLLTGEVEDIATALVKKDKFAPEDITTLRDKSQAIFDEFVADDAQRQVNIYEPERRDVLKGMKVTKEGQPDVNPALFLTIYKSSRIQVCGMIKNDAYVRYVQGPLFGKVLEEVGRFERKVEEAVA